MKYAINLPNGRKSGDPRKLTEFAQHAEVAGWDGVFVEGYVIWQGHDDAPTFDPWVALAEAGATWWSQYISPDSEKVMRRCIGEGPLRCA